MDPTPLISAADWVAGGTYLGSSAGRTFYRDDGEGTPLVLLHGFPTWSYDWAEVARILAADHRVVTLDFPGYGYSDKRGVDFSVGGSADAVERLLAHLGIAHVALVIHDYGGIVGQELLDRRGRGVLSFKVDAVHVLNSGIVYAAYRPTRVQKLLAMPVIGAFVASRLTKEKLHAGLNTVRGSNKLDAAAFDQLWVGMSRGDGQKLAYRHIRYNAERARHHRRWEEALFRFDGPIQLIWGLADPVSGRHVLEMARPLMPDAGIVELPRVGHFPQSEPPTEVAAAIRDAGARA
ncbi:alpha/beta fold hydrolase [Glacieibacterium megasporae]|uniref:alpha/beta fold hydrolase n=1 Tax=Glacieibacterium megasporae TaxID=2835787 RepID=UPI001C1E8B06|nr:alpha/beta hydrolase [Polymorphobacter megasporae]UAJ10624.1 alpha/beta hydrolase [Polymorphobacter megasporae]